MKKSIICMFVSSLFLSGCTNITQPALEEIGLITVLAFDFVDNNKMKMTASIPQSDPEAEKNTQIYSVETDLIDTGLLEISSKSDLTVTLKQVRVVFFSEEFAESGKMREVVKHLYNDATVRTLTHLVVVKDSAEAVLTTEYPDKQNTSVYINNFFQHRQSTLYSPLVTIHGFIHDTYNPLIDGLVPYVELKEELINIVGVSAFKEKEMIHMFSEDEGINLQIMQKQDALSVLVLQQEIGDSKKEKIFLKFIKHKAKITSNQDFKSPKVKIAITVNGTLSEYEGEKDLSDKKELAEIEKGLNKKIEDDVRKLLEKFQELSIDPVGLFESFRMRYKKDFTRDLRDELLSKVEFEIEVKSDLETTGTIKK
ncbi:Ger(x)C family spore germination protein [Paenisporosarcina antarctica]|uniref:Ger(X)C family spore germination protein n=1 Tax=Paenisporosarcina antarctica TaxID=417367 RepID=A0A4V1ANC7_9BACL|nr:Ger(x)C family spore germination protein [Paenisporosarcina antarctica]QBP42315.1 Ger(x)C family spore germination protein [Paenisporosarcina antarctica]